MPVPMSDDDNARPRFRQRCRSFPKRPVRPGPVAATAVSNSMPTRCSRPGRARCCRTQFQVRSCDRNRAWASAGRPPSAGSTGPRPYRNLPIRAENDPGDPERGLVRRQPRKQCPFPCRLQEHHPVPTVPTPTPARVGSEDPMTGNIRRRRSSGIQVVAFTSPDLSLRMPCSSVRFPASFTRSWQCFTIRATFR